MKITYNKESLYSEKEVEHFWWNFIHSAFPNGDIQANAVGKKTDGVVIDKSNNNLKMLIETKSNFDFTNPINQAKALIQSIFYIKQFEVKGKKLPRIVFIADEDEVFIIHTNALVKYLEYENIDWDSAPSNAYKNYQAMMMDISKDKDINPFVYKLSKNFNFDELKNNIINLNKDVKKLIKITDKNLQQVFEYFSTDVLRKNKLNVNEQVNLFMDLIINQFDNYLHPTKKNIMVSKTFGEIRVAQRKFISFFKHFNGEQYTHKQKEDLVAIIDRLIQDETRKRQGEFFTPTIWVDEAHKMIAEQFGDDWKEKYIVWDCAWGTGNLTRDYKFKELYCSTLNNSDIGTANQMNINPEATKFPFDFLNDSLDDLQTKAPGLWDAIQEGKEIIFFINPPYGSVQSFDNIKQNGGKSKKKIENTKIKKIMNNDKMGLSVKNLYSQFLYRIMSSQTKSKICLFSPLLFLTGSDFKLFRKKFLNSFGYVDGMLFDSKNFADVSSWGISFTIFDTNKFKTTNEFKISVKDIKDLEICTKEKKFLYNMDSKKGCNIWIREETKGIKATEDLPKLSSALKVKQKGYSNLIPKAFGYFFNAGNNVYYNGTNISLFSSCFSNKSGLSIIGENYKKCMALFLARKSIKQNWINDKDEYIAPTEAVLNSPEYKQWNNDAIVYSLFNTSSSQSSMRQIEYKNKLWDIKNEFFWLSKREMMDLADKYYFNELYKDAKNSEERYVYTLLQNTKLSPDAQELLDMSKELVKKSFEMRSALSEYETDWHLQAWDAGWYQIKKVLKDNYKKELKAFNTKYKLFEDRLRPYVYKFGFLK